MSYSLLIRCVFDPFRLFSLRVLLHATTPCTTSYLAYQPHINSTDSTAYLPASIPASLFNSGSKRLALPSLSPALIHGVAFIPLDSRFKAQSSWQRLVGSGLDLPSIRTSENPQKFIPRTQGEGRVSNVDALSLPWALLDILPSHAAKRA